MTGIYKITNQVNGKIYIGQSVDIIRRWREHRKALQANIQLPLYRAMNKYGLKNFSFEVIEECKKSELNEKEIYWIKFYNTTNPENGYNLSQGGHQGHFQKLNYSNLMEVKNLLKNQRIPLKDIAKKFNLSSIAIKNINQGYSYYDDNEVYPLRKNGNYCQNCGIRISTGAIYCVSCYNKKARTVVRPDRNELKHLIRNFPFTQIGQMFGVSDNAIRKWCDAEHLPRKKTEIVKYTDEEWAML